MQISNLGTRIYNKICFYCNKFNSYFLSLIYFQSLNYLKVGRGVSISGTKINIGKNCQIKDDSAILAGNGVVIIGDNVVLHENVLVRTFGYNISIGEGTTINRNTCILSQCSIGKNCSIAPNVVIVGANHNFSDRERLIKEQGSSSKGIIIGNDVWIGANATILDGVTIADGCVVAAGAVVRSSVLANSVVGGVPAKVIKER